MRRITYIITVVNLIFQFIYATLGQYRTSEMENIKYIFYIFRVEYMIVSGCFSAIVLVAICILIIKSIRKVYLLDFVALLLNIEYILYYVSFLKHQ